MAGLKKCIKATADLSDEDVSAVLEGFDSYKVRLKQKEATTLAIDDVIMSVESERTEFLELVYETHPDTRPQKELSMEFADVEQRIDDKINSAFDAAVEEYNAMPDSNNGKVLSGDRAKELSPDYMNDRTLA